LNRILFKSTYNIEEPKNCGHRYDLEFLKNIRCPRPTKITPARKSPL
jgi:hypothetical protein